MTESRRIGYFGPNRLDPPLPARRFGNKAATLSEMAALGVPVPPGFALAVEICEEFFADDGVLPDDVPALLAAGIESLEESTGLVFGGPRRPLLVSVRSGAPVSMPGIMETVLNVGLSRQTVEGLLFRTGNPRFAWDCYRRFLAQFGQVVCGHEPGPYAARVREALADAGVPDEDELDTAGLRQLAVQSERLYGELGTPFPTDPTAQVLACTEAVLRSWQGPRAEAFRRVAGALDAPGTAVTVEAMVFGNLGAASGAGVAFTRNPWSGEDRLLLDFRFGAQGEEVVSGERAGLDQDAFARIMPTRFAALQEIGDLLERHYRDMQDIEFTIEEGRLFILQSRAGKRTPFAALTIAAAMVREGLISETEAAERLEGVSLETIRTRRVVAGKDLVGEGVPASGGVATGTIALSGERAETDREYGPVVLVRPTASPDDIEGIGAASGLLVSRGGRTSHAAVVARQMGRVCVVNCRSLAIDAAGHRCTIGGTVLREGEVITIDGDTGAVYAGEVEIREERPSELIDAALTWRSARSSAPRNDPVRQA
ncbi:MAG: pyruvate, phosphate dikinase [Methanospirillum sp.]|nr:pyruvate, phosphate dikinase [Methanospirillum sp.]